MQNKLFLSELNINSEFYIDWEDDFIIAEMMYNGIIV